MTEDIKGLTRSVTRRRIGYTMAKRNRTNVQTTIYKTLHRTLKIEQLKARGEQTFYSGTWKRVSNVKNTLVFKTEWNLPKGFI
jgi:hypothetical protein